MASHLGAYPIDLRTLFRCEIPFRPARGDRFTSKWSRSNADSAQFGQASLRLLRVRFIGSDEPLNRLVGAWAGAPIGIKCANASNRVLSICLSDCQARRLPRFNGDRPAADSNRRGSSVAARAREVRTRGTAPAVGPLSAVGITGRHAGWSGLKLALRPSNARRMSASSERSPASLCLMAAVSVEIETHGCARTADPTCAQEAELRYDEPACVRQHPAPSLVVQPRRVKPGHARKS